MLNKKAQAWRTLVYAVLAGILIILLGILFLRVYNSQGGGLVKVGECATGKTPGVLDDLDNALGGDRKTENFGPNETIFVMPNVCPA